MKNIMRNLLCSNLKRKIKITNSLLVAFLITGSVAFGNTTDNENVEKLSKILEEKIDKAKNKMDLLENTVKANKTVLDTYDTHIKALNIIIGDHDQRLTNNEEKLSEHGMAIEALKGNKADKVETEKALGEIKETANKERKDRLSNEKTLNKGIMNNAANIEKNTKALKGKVDKQEAKLKEHDNEFVVLAAKNKKHDIKLENHAKVINNHENRLIAQENISSKNTQAINQNTRAINRINSRLDHMDNKINQGMSLMAAMTAIDFQNVGAGEVGIGAGVGHYVNSEGVAIGVAYAPTDVFRVNAKYSVTTGSIHNSAVAVGATYKFKLR